MLVKDVYICSAKFPSEERYGITNQLRRAAVSITCNISEGCGRKTDADFARFLDMASGSATEVESLLHLSCDLTFLSDVHQVELLNKVTEVQKMLVGLNDSLNNR